MRSARKALNSWPIIILDIALLTALSVALGASQVVLSPRQVLLGSTGGLTGTLSSL